MPWFIDPVWDFSNVTLADIYVLPNSYGAGGGGGGGSPSIVDAPPINAPAVLNNVTVAIPPAIPAAGAATPAIQAVSATNPESQATYGEQSTPAILTLLSSLEAAQTLALYLGRAQPQYWYSDLVVDLTRLSGADQTIIAQLEIGDQIRVSKRFNGVASPVIQSLFVEGIDHEITPRGHTVTISTSPAILYTDFIIGTSGLDDELYGLG